MASGIYAVINIGSLKLYVGSISTLKTRWPILMAALEQGNHPDCTLQETWNQSAGQRRFTFHTQSQLATSLDVVGLEQFRKDIEKIQ